MSEFRSGRLPKDAGKEVFTSMLVSQSPECIGVLRTLQKKLSRTKPSSPTAAAGTMSVESLPLLLSELGLEPRFLELIVARTSILWGLGRTDHEKQRKNRLMTGLTSSHNIALHGNPSNQLISFLWQLRSFCITSGSFVNHPFVENEAQGARGVEPRCTPQRWTGSRPDLVIELVPGRVVIEELLQEVCGAKPRGAGSVCSGRWSCGVFLDRAKR